MVALEYARRQNLELRPPRPGACQMCAAFHERNEHHNLLSMYYQHTFNAMHGRWPTFADATKDATEESRREYRTYLDRYGVEV